jgi:hypothetical protein
MFSFVRRAILSNDVFVSVSFLSAVQRVLFCAIPSPCTYIYRVPLQTTRFSIVCHISLCHRLASLWFSSRMHAEPVTLLCQFVYITHILGAITWDEIHRLTQSGM